MKALLFALLVSLLADPSAGVKHEKRGISDYTLPLFSILKRRTEGSDFPEN